MASTMQEYLSRAINESKQVNEMPDDKKKQMYRDGCYRLKNAFYEFSNAYMRSMGLLMQSKQSMNPKYKKYRDMIATSYEKMDHAISKHIEEMEKDNKNAIQNTPR
jgi:hypothetical protein